MNAILIATGRNDAFEGLQESQPVPLLPLADRPFLQHIVEYLASQGVRRFEFILSHLPEKIEAVFGDGARWGCSFHYHLLQATGDPLRLARTIAPGSGQNIVLGTAECLPELDLTAVSPTTLIDRSGVWSGWGVFEAQDILLPDFAALDRIDCLRYLSVETGEEFLRSQRAVLERSFPGLLISGREADPGIWISRNVALHPTAKLSPPVYIGENCRIDCGAQIGPFAVIGQNCIIDEHTILVDCLIAPGTYVGGGLELNSVIVDRNRLLNIRLQTSIVASEAFLLGSLTERAPSRRLYRLGSMVTALILLAFLWPFLLLTGLILNLSKRGSLVSEEIVRIPADPEAANWQPARLLRFRVEGSHGKAGEFLYTFIPGLMSVLKGELFLVGVQPRTRPQILSLSPDWRALYLNTKPGLITEAAVMFEGTATEDEVYTAEAFYSGTESLNHDCRLACLWFLKLVTGSDKTRAGLAKDSSL